jgi:hypothetical protein
MPAGCDFVCENNLCECFKKGFSITSPWPMGNIEDVIEASSDIGFKNALLNLKNQGRNYACITLPNVDNIEIKAYRINMWSNEANCIWQYDINYDGEEIEELIENPLIPDKCPKTSCELWNFETIIKNEILCPHCKQIMKQTRWFTN